MRGSSRRAIARVGVPLAMVVATVAPFAPPSVAQESPGVTLEASPAVIAFGDEVVLSGSTSPAAEGEDIQILDEEGRERASTTTNARGRFRVTLRPKYSARFTARWLAALSEPVDVKVRPRVNVSLKGVRLFGRAAVSGVVRPAQPQEARAQVTLRRNGKAVWTRRLTLGEGKRFNTRFKVRKPGSYRVVAQVKEPAGATGRGRSASLSPPLPSLGPGSSGAYVKLLERRLRELKYHLPGADRSYNYQTSDAVIAFNKVQGRARRGTVDGDTWRALARATVAKARFKTSGKHWEIDQTRQVVMLVKDGQVRRVIHTSTGRNGYTRNGTFTVHRKVAGYSPGRLYYPSYFDGLRAFHGWPEVPTYPASHGCARLPMWTARWVYDRAPIGMTVRVYH